MPVRRAVLSFSSLAFVLTLAASAPADVLEMYDGQRVHGRLLSVDRGWLEFLPLEAEYGGQPLRVAVAEVRSIRFDDTEPLPRVGRREEGGGGDRVSSVDPPSYRPRDRRRRRAARDEVSGTGRRPDEGRLMDRMITVSARQRWTDSGIDVSAGEVISFSVAGAVGLGDGRPLGPEGDLTDAVAAPLRPMPDRPAGALIGRIGSSPDDVFFIGDERLPFRVRTSGRLFLAVNDDDLEDDEGAFLVAVSR